MNKTRVVVLCGPNIPHQNTCATLISMGVNVVGICICDQNVKGLPVKTFTRIFKKDPLLAINQTMGKIVYGVLNNKRDKKAGETLFNRNEIQTTLDKWEGETHHTTNYSDKDTVDWLTQMDADAFVVHTPYWVSKKVREIPNKKIVIGGHPGLVPYYRGSHSAFWAIYNKEPTKVGYSVFWLDSGVDTGDLIYQNIIPISNTDSYITLGWKGMAETAKAQARVILDYDNGVEIPKTPHKTIPENSNYQNPTIWNYLKYRVIQHNTR